WLSVNNIGRSDFQSLLQPGHTLKPDKLHLPGIVLKLPDQPLRSFFTHFLQRHESTNNLRADHIGIDLLYLVKFRTVDIAEWIMLQEVTNSKNLQLFLKHVGFLRSYTF